MLKLVQLCRFKLQVTLSKNNTSKITNGGTDVVSWFVDVEKLFEQ